MKYMLDTNICIYTIKHKPDTVIQNFLLHDPEEMCISAVTYAELMHGVEKSRAADKNRIALSLFLSPLTILDFSVRAAEEYGKIRAELERRGLVLVTNNTKEFLRVEGLAAENWT